MCVVCFAGGSVLKVTSPHQRRLYFVPKASLVYCRDVLMRGVDIRRLASLFGGLEYGSAATNT